MFYIKRKKAIEMRLLVVQHKFSVQEVSEPPMRVFVVVFVCTRVKHIEHLDRLLVGVGGGLIAFTGSAVGFRSSRRSCRDSWRSLPVSE